MIVVEKSMWGVERLDKALKLLCCPNITLGYNSGVCASDIDVEDVSAATLDQLESAAFAQNISDTEFHSICVPNVLRGYASWSGVSIHCATPKSGILLDSFVRYQVLLQSLWYYAHQFSTNTIPDAASPGAASWHLRQILGPNPIETTPVRVFKEAVYTTSRIEQVLRAAKLTA